MENMILIMVDECGNEVEIDRFVIGSGLDDDYLNLWKALKIDRAAAMYPEAQSFYFEDRRHWNSLINELSMYG